MKRLLVVAEGASEKSFVDRILRPHLQTFDIYDVNCHTLGGVSKYSIVKQYLIKELYQSNVVITTMIDFYQLPLDFPGMKEPKKCHMEWVKSIEEQIKEDIEATQKRKFDNLIPYIQLHEFEALVFSSTKGVETLFEQDRVRIKDLQNIVKSFRDPEKIDDGQSTSPSARLKNIIKGYDKVIDGVNILYEIGIDRILARCSHFREWVNGLIDVLK